MLNENLANVTKEEDTSSHIPSLPLQFMKGSTANRPPAGDRLIWLLSNSARLLDSDPVVKVYKHWLVAGINFTPLSWQLRT